MRIAGDLHHARFGVVRFDAQFRFDRLHSEGKCGAYLGNVCKRISNFRCTGAGKLPTFQACPSLDPHALLTLGVQHRCLRNKCRLDFLVAGMLLFWETCPRIRAAPDVLQIAGNPEVPGKVSPKCSIPVNKKPRRHLFHRFRYVQPSVGLHTTVQIMS